MLHAWYIIAKNPGPSASEYEDLESAQGQQRVTYYYVSDSRNTSQGNPVASPRRQQYPGYGTVQGMRVPPPPGQQGAAQGQQAGEGSSEEQVPPSYEQVIAGDNKVQT